MGLIIVTTSGPLSLRPSAKISNLRSFCTRPCFKFQSMLNFWREKICQKKNWGVASVLDVKHFSVDSYHFILVLLKNISFQKWGHFLLPPPQPPKKTSPSSNESGFWKWPTHHPLHLVTTSDVASCGHHSFPSGNHHEPSKSSHQQSNAIKMAWFWRPSWYLLDPLEAIARPAKGQSSRNAEPFVKKQLACNWT